MDIDADTGTEIARADNLPGMGPMLSQMARADRNWTATMAAVIASRGSDGLLDEVTDDLLEGCGLGLIAGRLGVKVGELARFLGSREDEYRGMMKVKADLMAHETLEIADRADVEDVAVAKLRIDTRFKLAKHWHKEMYGDKEMQVGIGIGQPQAGSGGIQITFVDASEGRKAE